MNDELDTLRPEVADAVSALDETTCMTNPGLKWYATIRAELLRLAKVEAELAALKARIAKPVDRSHKYVQSKEHGGCSECGYPEWEPWHRVALVKAEE